MSHTLPVPASPAGLPAAHHVTLTERGPFLQPTCSCGWVGSARRSRPSARSEGREHVRQHADGSAARSQHADGSAARPTG